MRWLWCELVHRWRHWTWYRWDYGDPWPHCRLCDRDRGEA